MNIKGIDTILGLSGKPPKIIHLDYDTVKAGELVRQLWNKLHIAFLPYCFVCKVPLVWHTPPDADHILFHCPDCDRKWLTDDKWEAKVAKAKAAAEHEMKSVRLCAEC